jgi:hypothetical protein
VTVEILDAGMWTPEEAASYVAEPWQNAAASIIETGRRVIEARTRVASGQWLRAVELMPFGDSTARRLMQIGRHPDFQDQEHVPDLPPSCGTLAVLAQLPPGEIPKRIEAGEITPELDRSTAQSWVSTYSAARQEALNAWGQFSDAVLAALSYAKTYQPPEDTDNYTSATEVRERILELADIAQTWKETSE